MNNWYEEGICGEIVDKWKNNSITTLEYLMKVNRAASRSVLDLSQYPVVPWVAEMVNEKQPIIRDLTKTMGGLGSE